MSTLNATRRILYRLEPDVTAELIGLLLGREGGEDAARELLRVPRMRKHVAPCAGRLARLGLTLDVRTHVAVPPTPPAPPPLSARALARYDRERVYDEVWSDPTRRVAARYGVSDAMLWRVCRQLQVPKPPRGYWAKKRAGKPVPRRPWLKPLRIEPK